MPTPVAHCLAGSCAAILSARRWPAAETLPVVAAILFAANIPDADYVAVVHGRAVLERFHQGLSHSIGFIAVAAMPLALLLRQRLGFLRAWLLLAGAGLTHLLLDLMVVDRFPPIGFPFFWPFSTKLFHSPVTIFPGIDRVNILGAKNLREFIVELAWGIPALLLAGWRPRRLLRQGGPATVSGEKPASQAE